MLLTQIDARNETSKHLFLKSVKINTAFLCDTNVPVHFRAQQQAKYSSLQLKAYCIAAIGCLCCYIKLIWGESCNHRGHKFSSSLTVFPFKNQIEWPPVLTATASFPSVFLQLLQNPRQHPSLLAHNAAIMTKADLFFTIVFIPSTCGFCSSLLLSL